MGELEPNSPRQQPMPNVPVPFFCYGSNVEFLMRLVKAFNSLEFRWLQKRTDPISDLPRHDSVEASSESKTVDFRMIKEHISEGSYGFSGLSKDS